MFEHHRRSQLVVACALLVTSLLGGTPAGAQEDALHRKILSELQGFVSWLDANDARGFVGEIGWPDEAHGGESEQWNDLAEAWYQAADAAALWAGVWATGEWWHTTYKLAAYEDRRDPAGVDTPNTQAPVIEAHLSTDTYERAITVAGGEFAGPELVRTSTFSTTIPVGTTATITSTPRGPFGSLRAAASARFGSSSGGRRSSASWAAPCTRDRCSFSTP